MVMFEECEMLSHSILECIPNENIS